MGERELRPAGRYEWEQVIRRARLGGVITGRTGTAGKATKGGVSAALFKVVALTFASYADGSGRGVRPGDATVAVDAECALKTVKAVRVALLDLGLLEHVGGRRGGHGEEYRLALPSDLLDRVEVLTPAQHQLAARAMREAARGPRGGSSGPPDPPVDNPNVGGPVDHPNASPVEPCGGSSGPAYETCGGSSGPAVGGPVDPRSYPDRPEKITDQPVADVRTAVTQSRASPAANKPQDPIPEKCDHGLRARRRPDGTSSCAFCRRDAASPPSERPPLRLVHGGAA